VVLDAWTQTWWSLPQLPTLGLLAHEGSCVEMKGVSNLPAALQYAAAHACLRQRSAQSEQTLRTHDNAEGDEDTSGVVQPALPDDGFGAVIVRWFRRTVLGRRLRSLLQRSK